MKPLKKLEEIKNKMNNDFFKADNEEEISKKKAILYIVVIVVLLLLLLTSCTSGFFGKIGSIFRNEGSYNIDKDNNRKEEILNQNLKFYNDKFSMSLSDNNLKLSFTYDNIYPTSYTCTTSDASIATCYVSDGYVVVNPKKVGDVKIFLQTTVNGKIYKASTTVNITDGVRKIELSRTSSTIYLGCSPYRTIHFSLVGLTGEVTASSSDTSVVLASIEGSTLKLKGLKSGTAVVTLSLMYNNVPFTAKFNVTVKDGTNPNAVTPSKRPDTKPSTPETPEVPITPEVPDKSLSDSTILSLTSNVGNFTRTGDEFFLGVGSWTNSITIKAVPTNKDATMECLYKRADKSSYEKVDCDDSLSLKTGDNKVTLTITSVDKTSTTAYTITINKAEHSFIYDVYFGNAAYEEFDKDILFYSMYVPNDVTALPFRVDAGSGVEVSYMYNGVRYDTLNKLYLLTGVNSLKIYASYDGEVRTYQFLINRARPTLEDDTNTYLDNVVITTSNGRNVSLDFDSHISTYNSGVSSDVTSLDFTATPSSENATVTYIDEDSKEYTTLKGLVLKEGLNTVVIRVKNNGAIRDYVFNIYKAKANNSDVLTDIKIDGESIKGFSEDKLEYFITIPEDGASSVTIVGVPKNPSATVTYSPVGGVVTLKAGNNKAIITVDGRNYVINIYKKSSTLSSDTSLKRVLANVNGDTRDITSTLKTTVDNSVEYVTLTVTPADGATSDWYTKTVKLDEGVNLIPIKVTAGDKTTKVEYEITIKRESKIDIKPDGPIIEGGKITINGKEIDISSGLGMIRLGLNEDINFPIISVPNATVTYIYNNEKYTDVTKLNKKVNETIKNGGNDVDINIVLNDGTKENTYRIKVIKDKSFLNITAKGNQSNNYQLVYDEVNSTLMEYIYTMYIQHNETNLIMDFIPYDASNTNITYSLDGMVITYEQLLKELNSYNDGSVTRKNDNVKELIITVTSPDGLVKRTYIITIIKLTRRISVTTDKVECSIENGCEIDFTLLETAGNTTYPVIDPNVVATTDNQNVTTNGITYDYATSIGTVKLKPSKLMTPGNVNITIDAGYTKVVKPVEFTFSGDYQISIESNRYSIPLKPDAGNEGEVAVNIQVKGPLFIGNVASKYSATSGVLTIYDVGNSNTKIEVSVRDQDRVLKNNIEYVGEAEHPSSLPIKLTGNKAGRVYLDVKAYINGVQIGTTVTAEVEFVQKYVLTLWANGGIFDLQLPEKDTNGIEQHRRYLLHKNEEVNLALDENKPIKKVDECNYYEFNGYATSDGTMINYANNKFIAGVSSTSNVTNLYAKYATTPKSINNKLLTTYWEFEENIFKDSKVGNKLMMIAPGSNGQHTMHLTNKTGQPMEIVGFKLAENTVCANYNGQTKCLNMGYIIRYSPPGTINFNYYVGNGVGHAADDREFKNDNYYVLSSTNPSTYNLYSSTPVNKGSGIAIPANGTADVILHWKWIDSNWDVQIGKKAAQSVDGNITDQYSVALGIDYYINNSSCPTN